MKQAQRVKMFGSIRNLTLAAMMCALSVVIGIFCKTALNFGGGLFRITFENLPIILSGILFGPVTGGVVGLTTDLVSYMLSGQTYPPNLIVTLGASVIGVLSGAVSHFIVRKKGKVQIIASGAAAHIVGSMIIKPIGLYQFYGILVLWRIPLYLVIAPLEILVICLLLRRRSFARVVGYTEEKREMSYDDALNYIHKINWCFCKPGLERTKELCKKLGNPQKKLKFIHVAGTNGKGSFCAMLASVLSSAGYKTGLFTSPFVKVFNERMVIDGKMISNEELAALTERIKPVADSMEEKPTEFELITALAFEYFAENGCDYVVLECGLGGRLDSTNIIDTSVLSVITGIALDHTAILGDTVEKIAFEKAGIIKRGVPCLWCGDDAYAAKVIKERAAELSAPFYTVDHAKTEIKEFTLNGTKFDFCEYKDVFIPLLGEYQPFNASNVLTAINILREKGMKISTDDIRRGLKYTVWHARFEIINKAPLVIADGGHNPQGVRTAVKSVRRYFGGAKLNVVSGVMADKDYEYMAEQIGLVASEVYCLTPDNPRALSAECYAEIYNKKGIRASAYATVLDAVSAALKDAKANNKAVICLGSLYMYSEICDSVERLKKGLLDK